MKLYEIASEYRALDAALDASGGEVTPEIQAMMDGLDGELEVKVNAVCGLIREAQAEADGVKDEADRLSGRAASARRRANRLRTFLLDALKASGKERVKTTRFTVWPAKAGTPSIEWRGSGPPPEGFRKTQVVLDSKAAHEAHKAGTLPGGFVARYSEFLGMR